MLVSTVTAMTRGRFVRARAAVSLAASLAALGAQKGERVGMPGLMRFKVDVKRRAYESEIAKAPSGGRNVELTIDSEVQHVAQDALQAAVIENHAVSRLLPLTTAACRNVPSYSNPSRPAARIEASLRALHFHSYRR